MIWIFVAITIAATHYVAFKWGAIVTLQRCKADIAGMYDERSADAMRALGDSPAVSTRSHEPKIERRLDRGDTGARRGALR